MNYGSLEAAQTYVAKGWPVLPLRPSSKTPVTRHGKKNATLDADIILNWWEADPNCGVGILTGEASGLVVVDVDPRNGGEESFERLAEAIGGFPPTLECETGGGGRHLYYALPGGVSGLRDRPSINGYHGVDIKCDGYVVAPPSHHPSGRRYEFANALPPAPVPAALLAMISAPAEKSARTLAGVVPEGGRNDTLFREACRLRGAGILPEAIHAAVAAENAAHCSPPLPAEEVRQLVESALRYNPNPEPLSELSLTRGVVVAMDGNYRFDPASSAWWVWEGEGATWALDRDGVVLRLIKGELDSLAAEADAVPDSKTRQRAQEAVRKMSTSRGVAAVERLAQSEPGIPITADAFDRDPWLIGVPNGTVDLRAGTLLPAARDAHISRQASVAFDPTALAPRWQQFLEEVTGGDTDLGGYLQRLGGLALTGDISVQAFHVLLGAGANGKSLFMNTLAGVLGDYAHTASGSLLTEKAAGGASPDLAALRGPRLALISEANANDRLDASLMKRISGGEPITARRLYSGPETFQPTATLLLGCNHLPRLDAEDDAIWRRLRVVPFDRVFGADEQDPHLADKLRAEAPGILRWAVEGAVAFASEGLGTCPAVAAATAAARADVDSVGAFLTERCDEGADSMEQPQRLYDAYRHFANSNAAAPVSANGFGRSLSRRGIGISKHNGHRVRTGVRLKAGGLV